MGKEIPAAGTIVWRRRAGTLEVALVHRPKYDDWSWPKGKLDKGESLAVCAGRETQEETGLAVRLGRPLSPAAYTVLDKGGAVATKVVAYWAAEVVGGDGQLVNEIDEVAWLSAEDAHRRLDYARDRDQLMEVVRADNAGTLQTWPLVIVRHAKALSRRAWAGGDSSRPLDDTGREQAETLVPLLAAYGIERLVTSTSARCTQTLAPYAASASLPLRTRVGLSEEGHDSEPERAVRHLRRLIERGEPSALCTHGPVLPAVLRELATSCEPEPGRQVFEFVDRPLGKGDILIAHLCGAGADHPARVVAVEHLPAS